MKTVVLPILWVALGASSVPSAERLPTAPSAMPPYVAQALPFEQRLAVLSEVSDKTLAVKKFDAGWVRTLDQRGEPIVYSRSNSADFDFIGMPIGGLCAGQLYLGGDGKLWGWDIFNTKGMRDVRGVAAHARPYQRSEPDLKAHYQLNQGFALRLQNGAGAATRTLDRDGFRNITFRGEYPIGYVTYADAALPVQVELEAFSPFIPLDLDNSTYPATVLAYTIKNAGTREVSGELMGWLENAVCIKSQSGLAGQWRNRIEKIDDMTLLHCTAAPPSVAPAEASNRPDILFEDFEGDLGQWTVEGEAFAGNPNPNFHHQPLQGFKGKGLADSFRNSGRTDALAGPSDAPTGKLISKSFTLERKAIQLLIGGGNHVWGYVQAPGRLFPVIEQRLREMVDYREGIGFDPTTGRIGHRAESNMSDAVDGQSGSILRTYLAHQMQPDDAFLRRVYPRMKQAMDYLTVTYDADRDGVLTGGQHNTLDAKWYGKITWLSLHYTAALRAAAAMADDMGDSDYAKQCGALADRGRRYIETELFNGEYFFHEADPAHPKSPGVYNGLEYSQLLGQSWAYQVGLGQILDPAKAATHLRSLWKYNFATDVGPFREHYKNGRWHAMPGEGGTIACTWPRGGDEALRLGNQHFAGYLNECQPGYEWAATSLYMWHDMPYHALAHTRTMHDRYHASKRNPWNEVEWGSHYSRSMASYGVFIAACGFEYHGPKGYLAFSPRITPENFKVAFTSATGWGSFTQKRTARQQTETLEVKYGSLRLQTLAFDLPLGAHARNLKLTVAERPLPATFTQPANRVVIALREPVTVMAGQTLRLETSL